MEKITIDGFGPIKYAEIEIKKLLVLIGEQASGKSTIAKLIYYFKSIADDFFLSYYESDQEGFDITADLIFKARNKFYDYFGSTRHLQDFRIVYQYGNSKSLTLRRNLDGNLEVTFSQTIMQQLGSREIRGIKVNLLNVRNRIKQEVNPKSRLTQKNEELRLIDELAKKIDLVFAGGHDSKLFVIAGRESTVSYQSTFESYLATTLSNEVASLRGNRPILNGQTVDEILMLDFIKVVQEMRSIFQKYGSFESVKERTGSTMSSEVFSFLNQRIGAVLKARYVIDSMGEKLEHETGYVYLKDSSSGQKESIRIVQDIMLSVLEEKKSLRVFEEPEAHLFPVAQKNLIELLVFMANAQRENQVIITTHSPYVLTILNNLLFAHLVVKQNPEVDLEVSNLIPNPFRIDGDLFSAYSLGNSSDIERPYCLDLLDADVGMIGQNFLDSVSEKLGYEFQTLLDIHSKSFSTHEE